MNYDSYVSYLNDMKHLTLREISLYEKFIGKEVFEQEQEELEQYRETIEDKIFNTVEIFLPLEYLFQTFDLDDFQKYCVRLSLMPELISGFSCDLDFVVSSYAAVNHTESFELKKIELLKYFSSENILSRVFLKTEKTYSNSRLLELLQCSNRIRTFAIDGSLFSNCLKHKAELWDYMQYEKNRTKEKSLIEDLNINQLDTLNKEWEGNFNVFYLYGLPGSGKKEIIKQFCYQKGISVIFVKKPVIGDNYVALINQINLEAAISRSVVCFEEVEEIEDFSMYVNEICTRCFIVCNKEYIDYFEQKNCNVSYIFFSKPTMAEQIKFWNQMKNYYNMHGSMEFKRIACKFQMTFGQIKEVMEESKREIQKHCSDTVSEEIICKICRKKKSAKIINKKIIKIETYHVWDELILPKVSKDMLLKVCNQVENRHKVYETWGFDKKFAYGTGVSVIFTGAPGTGKTMAAQVVAGRLGLDLYKVNLAGVVSKYIGDTEKNLEEIFDEAASNQAVLFFDEADTLFSKRTEVKNSNDKYSNMEAAYMLQKIEEHKGICILATNYLQNFDEAFKRRMKFIIDFPFPSVDYRKTLWKQCFPQSAPLDNDIDWDFLSNNFELSGSSIKNIALNAAFESAEEGSNISMKSILLSLKDECEKTGKHMSKYELGQYYLLLGER